MIFAPRLDLDFRHKCLSVQATGDTTDAVKVVGDCKKLSLLGSMWTFKSRNENSAVRYLGVEDNNRIFTCSYTYNPNYTSQILFRVNKETKQIEQIEMSILSYGRTYIITMSCAHFKNNILNLIDVSGVCYLDGSTITIRIDDISEARKPTFNLF